MDSNKAKNNSNPREKAKLFSILFWWWIKDLFGKGYTNVLTFQDLYEPLKKDRSKFLGNKLEKQWITELKRAQRINDQPNLFKTIFVTFRKEIFFLGIIHFFLDLIFRLGLPILLGLLLRYFNLQTTIKFEEAFIYFMAFILTNMLTILLENHLYFRAYHLAGRIRIAMSSLLYKKTLKLNSTVLGETSTGKIVNLLANDVNRFEFFIIFLHTMWTAPLATLIVAYILYIEAHFAGLIGLIIMLSSVLVQVYTGKLSSKYRLESAKRTDKRVRLVDEIISGVHVIKMFVWEKPFYALVEFSRFLELRVIKKSAYIRGLFMTIFISITRIALYCTIIAMLMMGEQLTIDKIFVFGSFYNILSYSLTGRFVRSFAELAECKVSVTRIQSFLLMEEFQADNIIISKNVRAVMCKDVDDDNVEMEDNSEKTWCIKVNNVSVKWCSNLLNNTLENLSIELEKGKLYAAIGTIGAGKSSFLSMILGEIKFVKGNINLIGNISYAAQDAWVFGASIQQNILFGQEFNKERYVSVIDACAIAKDLEEFSDADNTLIDEKGSSLSGGQKVRINLARAIYKEADIYLLDDPLSAVDVNVGKYLFEKCILQYLKDKTRILVTHQLQNIKNVDGIMLFDQGKMQYYKDYRKLLEAHPEYNNLIVRDNDESSNKDNCVENINVRKQCTSIENKFQLFGCKERVTEDNKKSKKFNDILEETSKDVMKGSVFLYYFQLDSSLCTAFIMVILFILTQILVILNDFYVPFIVTAEKNKNDFNKQSNASNSFTSEKDVIPKESFYSTETYIYFYTAIVLSIFLIGLLRSYVFFNACLRNNKCLHNLTLAAILRARLHFFNTNPSGRILNRFSKDMATVDEHLPRTLLDTAQVLLTIFGAFIVTCIINPIFLIYGLVISYVTYWIKKIYLKTSKNLKRLEGMTRSPIFTHLNVTLNGISTIRAFKSQTNLNEEFDKFQDNHTSSWYLCTACGFAYSFALDLCTLSFIICITLNFLIFKDQFNSGEVGLAITQILWVTTMVQWGMRQIAEVNNQMLSVERILEYKQIPPEDNVYNQIKSFKKTKNENEQNLLPTIIQRLEHWPSEGTITFRDIFMAYEKEKKPVLKNLNFQINAMEKIGIVGRTGAGKSSLIYAIFRLAYLNGIIEIDKIDTATISLEELRSRISIIPQDPVLFSGTLRCNLDPFNEFSDKDLWGALEEVELKDSIVGYKNGLNYRVLNKGMNFSVGQRQLICLARAILRNNCILIVDEATANVDPQTDYFIQQTIRRKFSSCTILTIAHRLNIIIDSDKIMFMDNGHLVEFDHPYKLLQKKESHFNILAKKTGDVMYKQLFKLAQQCYNEKCNNCI